MNGIGAQINLRSFTVSWRWTISSFRYFQWSHTLQCLKYIFVDYSSGVGHQGPRGLIAIGKPLRWFQGILIKSKVGDTNKLSALQLPAPDRLRITYQIERRNRCAPHTSPDRPWRLRRSDRPTYYLHMPDDLHSATI